MVTVTVITTLASCTLFSALCYSHSCPSAWAQTLCLKQEIHVRLVLWDLVSGEDCLPSSQRWLVLRMYSHDYSQVDTLGGDEDLVL